MSGQQGRAVFGWVLLAWLVNVAVLVLQPIVRGGGWHPAFGLTLALAPVLLVGSFFLHERWPRRLLRFAAKTIANGLALAALWGLLYGVRYSSWHDRFQWGAALLIAIAASVLVSRHPRWRDEQRDT